MSPKANSNPPKKMGNNNIFSNFEPLQNGPERPSVKQQNQ